jgi:hypothetical protein
MIKDLLYVDMNDFCKKVIAKANFGNHTLINHGWSSFLGNGKRGEYETTTYLNNPNDHVERIKMFIRVDTENESVIVIHKYARNIDKLEQFAKELLFGETKPTSNKDEEIEECVYLSVDENGRLNIQVDHEDRSGVESCCVSTTDVETEWSDRLTTREIEENSVK